MNNVKVLGDICTVSSSKRIHLADYVENGIPFYRSKEIIELASGRSLSETLFISLEKYEEIKKSFPVPKVNDILITSVGTIGISYLVKDGNFYFKDGNLTWLRDIDEMFVDINYLYKWLKSNFFKYQISNNNIGAVQKAITIDYLRKVKINLPDLPNQQKIASVLSALDDKIELNNKINTELEAMAKTLYDYWFVQFDFPNAVGKPYKSSGGERVYDAVLKREIPKGWEVKKLAELNSVLVRGISPKYIEKGGIQVINQRCIRDNTIDFSLSRLHNHIVKPVHKIIEVGDILVNSTGVGTLGRVALVKRLPYSKITVDSHVTIVRIDPSEANATFTGVSMLQKQTEIEKLGEGSTGQTELSRENLGKLLFVMPCRTLQDSFANVIRPILEKISNNERQNEELASLRDWLLPMLMNGQVTVTEAYEEVEQKLRMVAEGEARYTAIK